MSQRIAGILLALMLVSRMAFASCAGCTTLFAENWQNYGTPPYTSGVQTIGPWTANVCGNIGCGKVQIVCAAGLPWNPSNVGGNGCYLHTEPGGVSAPNNGTGVYLPFGTPHRDVLISFSFRYTGTLTAGASKNFFLRWNSNDVTPVGTDFATGNLDDTGHITSYGGATTNALTVSTWQFYSECVEWGAGSSNGKDYITVAGTNWLSATGLSGTLNAKAVGDIALDNEYSGNTGMDFGPVLISDPGTCTASTFYQQSDVYAQNILPASNGTITWTPSAGTNWSNVLSGSGNNNASNTNGQQDLYNLAASSVGTITAQGILAQFQNDAIGDRIPLPVSTVSGVTSTGTVTNTLPAVGSYAASMLPIAGSVLPTQIGVKVNN